MSYTITPNMFPPAILGEACDIEVEDNVIPDLSYEDVLLWNEREQLKIQATRE